ncbi:MAG: hypothetical protein GY841_12655 [FCB group bacterium]|nr:hypothetical protein [FCB group bacterium]
MMKSGYTLTGLLVVLLTLGVIGCTDKTGDNPTRAEVGEQGLVTNQSNHTFSIFFSTAKDPGFKPIRVYLPPGYDLSGGGIRYPSLYLLPPFRSDELYYFEHGLAAVADRLIAEGKIEPMIIVTLDGRSHLGGSFYTNSACQGNHFTALFTDTSFQEYAAPGTESLYPDGGVLMYEAEATITRIDDIFRTFDDPSRRAIGGVGMGGYGAFRAVLQTDLFGSVSAVNAPLDFDGNGSGGFLTLLDEVFINDFGAIDTAEGDLEASLILSASAAFTPHIAAFDIDSLYQDVFGQRTFTFSVDDTLTDDFRSFKAEYNIHLPYDSAGARHDYIWDLWMENNIANLYAVADPAIAADFMTMNKLLVSSSDAVFHYGEQMTAFTGFLGSNSMTYQTQTFNGTDRLSATANHYLYDLLEDILIFHSNNLNPTN